MKLRQFIIKEDVESAKKKEADAKEDYLDAKQETLDAEKQAAKRLSTESIEDLPDQEGRMAKTQLYTIIHHAHEVYKSLDNEQQLPAWWQSHLAKAEDLILQMHSYFTFEKDQESEKEK